ncbi:MAG: hypothetical protein ABI867_01295 [Kofleriaceae bacterium]
MLAVVGLVACGGGLPDIGDRPTAPEVNDPAFTVREVGGWYLAGDAATPAQDEITAIVEAAPGTEFVDVWVAELEPVRMSKQANGTFGTILPIAGLPIGTYDILFAADGDSVAFAKVQFNRTAPYYVVVSTDWDFSDPGDRVIANQTLMHELHPELVMTHFVGPYTFTDPEVLPARQQQLVSWLVEQRDLHHDEIGLHIHPYCNFVEHAGVTCVIDQSTVYGMDTTGYTIKVGAYDRTQMGTLLQHAGDLFEQNGLNRPKTFRAGGWTATADTLAALDDKGFTADTSALNWAKIEEWEGVMNGELYRWNMENWGPIGDTSQPYFPNQTDPLSTAAPALALLEVPDNGAMIDYVTLPEMNALFDANWDGALLSSPKVLMMGFHPSKTFSIPEYDRVDGFLDYADMHLANRHLGPVVYITLDGLVPAFRP